MLEYTVPDVARTAWDRARAQWDDTAAHDELLRLTNLHGCYAWVAARYREVRGDGDAIDPIAERQLDRVRRAAEVALLASGTPRAAPQKKTYQSTVLLIGLVMIMIVIGVVYAMYRRAQAATEAPSHGPPASRVR
ncbi:MAG: hypothetical protein JWP01_965 [Myxococcales bacterium]|nr:hypothetical protein [Myxococcales bacterium]